MLFDYSNGKYHKNQVVQVNPINLNLNLAYKQAIAVTRATRKKRVPNRLTRKSTMCLRQNPAWRLESLSWCKCGHCTLKPKAIESFCCYEKALEYDEYDALLKEAEAQLGKC